MKNLIALLIVLVAITLPSTSHAQGRFKGQAYLTNYFDSQGSDIYSLPSDVETVLPIDFQFSQDKRTGKYSVKNARSQKINCSRRSNTYSCPSRSYLNHPIAGVCKAEQKVILVIGSRGATVTITRDLDCPQYPYGAFAKYIAAFQRR